MPASAALTLLLTGGQGFVGTAMRRVISERRPEWRVVAPLGPEAASDPGGGEPGALLDVLDPAGLEAWVARAQPDVVVHLAAMAAVTAGAKNPRLAWEVNLQGTLNLVFALQRRAPEAHLLHLSTAEVYGSSAAEGVLTERSLLQPLNSYAASKAAADLLVRQAAAEGLSATVLRPFNQIGRGQSEAFALPGFAAQIARIEAGLQPPVLRVGAINEERDFLPVEDAIDAYIRAVERRRDLRGAVLNICSGRCRPVRELLDVMLALSPMAIEVSIDPTRLRPTPSPRIAGDNACARVSLGWSPDGSLRSALQAVLEEQRNRLTHQPRLGAG